MHLFNWSEKGFTLHSGQQSHFKIDCDALTNEDMAAISLALRDLLPPYGHVEAVPTGGERLMRYMAQLQNPLCETILIVDDVLTTGASMEGWRAGRDNVIGAVIFARGNWLVPPDWITPLFWMKGE